MKELAFWQTKTLNEMTAAEWESLCDGCGKCCLHKLEDEDTGDVYYTDVACRYLHEQTCRCTQYDDRKALVATCLTLTPADIGKFHWLPGTCAYRLLAEGQDLPSWHHLITGSYDSVHSAGISVRGKVQKETAVAEEDLEDHVVYWVD